MCIGGGFFKKILPLAAMAAAAYFTGGGSLFGSGAAAGAGAGASAASSVAGESMLGALTEGGALSSGLVSSIAPSMTSTLTSGGIASGLGGALTTGLNFAKDNSFWLGQGLNAAGVGANYIAQNQRISDYNKIQNDYMARTDALQGQADVVTGQALDGFSQANQSAMGDASYQARLEATKGAFTNPNNTFMPTADSAPTDVKSDQARKMSDILDLGRAQIANQSKLNSFGDVSMNNNLNLAESGRKIATLGNFQSGNTNTFNSQANTNMIKPRTAGTIGSILQGAGALSNAYASTRPKNWTNTTIG